MLNAGLIEQACNLIDSTLDAVEYLKYSLSSDRSNNENRRQIASSFHFIYQKKVELCLHRGNTAQAFTYADSAKSSLREVIDHDFWALGSFGESMNKNFSALGMIDSNINIDVDENYGIKKPLFYIRVQRILLEKVIQGIYKIFPRENGMAAQHIAASNDNLLSWFQDTIDPKTLVYSWFICSDFFLVFIVTKQCDEPRVIKSSEQQLQDLNDWLTEFQSCLHTNNRVHKAPELLSSVLNKGASTLLLDKLLEDTETKIYKNGLSLSLYNKLVLVPHRYINVFPIHALEIFLTANEGSQTLTDRFSKGVSYLPSCSLILSLGEADIMSSHNALTPKKLLALKNSTLAGADIEIGAITKKFEKVKLLTGADIEQLPSDAGSMLMHVDFSRSHYIHFACHGSFVPNDDRKSGLLVTDRMHPLGWISMDCLLSNSFSEARLVVLSACETGLTDTEDTGSSYVSLAYAFLINGCFNVVCSLWKVADLSTALLMVVFYDRLFMSHKPSIPQALRYAQIWVRDATVERIEALISSQPWNPTVKWYLKNKLNLRSLRKHDTPFSSPYYWAGFYAVSRE
ncbi:MAG: CHAT domain-containing protein [Cyanobacteria bacterium J06650_10]